VPARSTPKECQFKDVTCNVVLPDNRGTYCKPHGEVMRKRGKAVTDAAANARRKADVDFARNPEPLDDGALLVSPANVRALALQVASLQRAISGYYEAVTQVNRTARYGPTEYRVEDGQAFADAATEVCESAKRARDAIRRALGSP